MAFWKFEIRIKRQITQKFKMNPKTLGDHIRRKRIMLNQLQKDVADCLQVSEDTITGWENNRTQPMIHNYPSIIKYLGYMPILVNQDSIGGRIFHYRCINGINQKKLAKLVNVEASTVASWEKGEFKPNPRALKRLLKLL
ncbi:MAG: helix-turn-helix domain-containing protein [Bacteroidetes bacterium]|nr:MAG: helix-turn-helix domain-containing protein [Bacteroidota bacterium]REK06554.1 MAG: helix-turn-helix domain-containing protein [Bacteroidota bacterium]REK33320.1 MAG: helix-turn-helix domain-containing protein [Bacteroidota bacterium]REK49720.1 MAG: helix-turn-helix domain-containing protein [Bacteroidota bacterium]